jgi:O-antigen/teichoic acid export membrane protein
VITGSEKRNSLATSAAWNTLSGLWGIALVFFATPVLVSHLGTEHYGLYMLLMAVAGTLSVLNLGLGDATLRYVAYHYARNALAGVNRVLGATLTVYLITATLGALLLWFAAEHVAGILALDPADAELGPRLVKLVGVLFSVSLMGGAVAAIPQALQRYDVASRISIFQTTMQTGGSVGVVLAGYGLDVMLSWSIILAVVMLVIHGIIAKRLVPTVQLYPHPTRAALREVFGYGVYALLTQVLGIIWAQADKLLLGTLVSAASVGFLTIPQNVAFRGMGLINQLGAALFPRFAALEDLEAKRRLFLNSVWLLLAASVTVYVPLTVLFPDLLRVWLNESFASQSGSVAQVIAFSCIIRGAFIPYEMLFKGMGRPEYVTLVFVGSGLTGLIANSILIPAFGLSGAGYAYAITPIWGVLALYFASKNFLRLPDMRALGRVLAVPLGVGLVVLGVMFYVHRLLEFDTWTAVVCFGILGAISVLAAMLTTDLLIGGRNSYADMTASFVREAFAQVVNSMRRSSGN